MSYDHSCSFQRVPAPSERLADFVHVLVTSALLNAFEMGLMLELQWLRVLPAKPWVRPALSGLPVSVSVVVPGGSWSLKTATITKQTADFSKRGKSKLVHAGQGQYFDFCDPVVKEIIISLCTVKTAI